MPGIFDFVDFVDSYRNYGEEDVPDTTEQETAVAYEMDGDGDVIMEDMFEKKAKRTLRFPSFISSAVTTLFASLPSSRS